jgi:enoyl-CoA hydratase/carnithine racemase
MGELVEVAPAGENGVAVLTMQRANKRNALSIALRDAMSDALDQLAVDEACRSVVITGAGEVFSAGFDLGEFSQPEVADQLWTSSDRWHRTIIEFPLPTVAGVNGPAHGGGFDLAVMCDLRVVATTAVLSHPEHSFSDIVYAPLHDAIGGAAARDVALTGRKIGADEALALGLASRVVEPDAVLTAAVGVAAEIATAPRDVLLRMKAKILRRARIEPGATLEL